MGAILKKMTIFGKGNALRPVENHDASREIRFYLRKEFRAAEIEFYLHKEFSAAEIRMGAMFMKMVVFLKQNAFCRNR